jgi:hypothetical protein
MVNSAPSVPPAYLEGLEDAPAEVKAVIRNDPRKPETDPTLGIPVQVNRTGTPRHRLVALGDSLTQGFQSGAIYNTQLSYPMLIARWDGTEIFVTLSILPDQEMDCRSTWRSWFENWASDFRWQTELMRSISFKFSPGSEATWTPLRISGKGADQTRLLPQQQDRLITTWLFTVGTSATLFPAQLKPPRM